MDADDPRHGQYAGAVQHWFDKEKPCDDCARAEWRYRKTRQLRHLHGDTPNVPSLGTVRRYQALMALGWTGPQIAEASGISINSLRSISYHGSTVVRRETAAAVATAFEQMCMTRPEGHYANRMRATAQRRGWPPPLAWDDIDNDPEPPAVENDDHPEDRIDTAVVQRVLDGRPRPRQLTRAEAAEIVRVLLLRGISTYEIERRYGLKPERYRKAAA